MLIVRHLGTPNSGFNGCHCMRDPVLYRSMLSPRGDARCCCWQPLKERTLNIPLFKEDFCSNIQGEQGGKLFGKSWKKISHQNEVETRLVQVMIDAPFDSRVY